MRLRPGGVRERLARSFLLRLGVVVAWITAVMLGLYVGLGMSGGWAHLLTSAVTLPLVLYFELVLAKTAPRVETAPVAPAEARPVDGSRQRRIERGRLALRAYRRLWFAEGALALAAGVLATWVPGTADRLLELARHFPGLASLADGLAVLHPDLGARQPVILYLAIWWLTLPVKTVCLYLSEDGLRVELGRTSDPVTFRSVLYTLLGTPLAWAAPAALFWIVGRDLAAGEPGLADPLSLRFAFVIGPLANGPLIAWAVWSFYGFIIGLLSTRLVEIADLVRRRLAVKPPDVPPR